jgi:hypothetical protein
MTNFLKTQSDKKHKIPNLVVYNHAASLQLKASIYHQNCRPSLDPDPWLTPEKSIALWTPPQGVDGYLYAKGPKTV